MSDEVLNSETCETCGAGVTPLGADDSFSAHVLDYEDPHRTLDYVRARLPGSLVGNGAPSNAQSGVVVGSRYFDMMASVGYVYCMTSSDPLTYAWVKDSGQDRMATLLSQYATKSYVSDSLASYIKTSDAQTMFAGQSAVTALQTDVTELKTWRNSSSFATVSYVTQSVANMATTGWVAQQLNGFQPTLSTANAGNGVTISGSGTSAVISVSTDVATHVVPGLMSADDKAYLDLLPGILSGKQDVLTADNAGTWITIAAPNGTPRISASIPVATTSSAGLLSSTDKAAIDSMRAVVDEMAGSAGIALATRDTIGGVRVSATNVVDHTQNGTDQNGNPVYVQLDESVIESYGYKACCLGTFDGLLYAPVAPRANAVQFGTVKVSGDSLTSLDDYLPVRISTAGVLYSSTEVRKIASSTALGGIMVSPDVLSDTDGWSPVRVSSTGLAYFRSTSLEIASSLVLGGIYVGAGTLTANQVSGDEWTPIRVDSDGIAYSATPLASGSERGMVLVDSAVLEDTTGYKLCKVDASGFLYAPGTDPAQPSVAGTVVPDATPVDDADPGDYIPCRVDANGVIYAKGYDDAIATLQHQGAGHDVLYTPTVTDGVCALKNNAMNYVSASSVSSGTQLSVPARLSPATNARDFFVIVEIPSSYADTSFSFASTVISPTEGETVRLYAASDDGIESGSDGLTFTGVTPGMIVMVYFTEVISGVFAVSRKLTSRVA